MVRLLALSNPRVAQSFIDYMASKKIDIKMMPEGEGQFSLWLIDEAHQQITQQELQRFIDNPNHKRYQLASWDMAESREQKFHYNNPKMMQMIKSKAGPFTLLIMLVCVAIFTLQQLGLQNTVFDLFHFPDQDAQRWQAWRWFTHALMHFSILHITFNLLWWWQFGGDVEQKLGLNKLMQIFLITSLLSGAGQFIVEGANFGGLSGVVYGLAGYLWIIGTKAPQLGISIPRPVFGFMLVWLVLGYVQPYMAIANTAHLMGLVSGLAIGLFDVRKTYAK
jgi:GlpG protein